MNEVGATYIIRALQEELARINENRIVLIATVQQQQDEIARLAEQVSRYKPADDAVGEG